MAGYFPSMLRPLDHPVKAIILLFGSWKVLLLLIALCSPGPGYDTSTTLIQPYVSFDRHLTLSSILSIISNKLTRWDAIYFTKIASRGYLFEQEWAFGLGWTHVIASVAAGVRSLTGAGDDLFVESLAGIAVAHLSHGLSAIVLYSLGREIFSGPSSKKLALIAASLHVFSPAGMFLSAPYGESYFALLSFLGYLFFVRGCSNGPNTLLGDMYIIVAGVAFGLSTTIRGNGLLNGILFLEELLKLVLSIKSLNWSVIRRTVAVVIGGLFVGAGILGPQIIAYIEYCGDPFSAEKPNTRIWCHNTLPSIYGFVQAHYWDVGLFKYWTVSNIPLFLIAAPMLSITLYSAFSSMYWTTKGATKSLLVDEPGFSGLVEKNQRTRYLLRSLAIPQLVLGITAITTYHVQIVNRISSAYPVWYFYLASLILGEFDSARGRKGEIPGKQISKRIEESIVMVRLAIIYAVVQGGLFATFLPPA